MGRYNWHTINARRRGAFLLTRPPAGPKQRNVAQDLEDCLIEHSILRPLCGFSDPYRALILAHVRPDSGVSLANSRSSQDVDEPLRVRSHRLATGHYLALWVGQQERSSVTFATARLYRQPVHRRSCLVCRTGASRAAVELRDGVAWTSSDDHS